MGKLEEPRIVDAYMEFVVDGKLGFSREEFDGSVDNSWSNVVVVDVPNDVSSLRELVLSV